jgi:lipoyl(octanoyl) transferase
MTSPTHAEPGLIRHLGHADYEDTFAAMRAFTAARTPETRDEVWIVEHPPVFTLGLGADRAHILANAGVDAIPVVQTDRGGEVTYHGPGQVVIYVLMDLRRNKPGGKLYAPKSSRPSSMCWRRIISQASASPARPASTWPAALTKVQKSPRLA